MFLKKTKGLKPYISKYFKMQLKNFTEETPNENEPISNEKKKRKVINLDNKHNVKCLILHPVFPEK
jgi:hypothetical protein